MQANGWLRWQPMVCQHDGQKHETKKQNICEMSSASGSQIMTKEQIISKSNYQSDTAGAPYP